MKIRSFEFSIRELAGSMGDFGTFFPLAVGYIAVCGLDPAGLLVMIGCANIATGLFYRLPMPIQPMKVIAVVAIAQQWTPQEVYASGVTMGIVWVVFSLTGIMRWIARVTPNAVVRGIQAALGVVLAIKAFEMLSTAWVLGIAAIVIVLTLRKSRVAPAAIVLMAMGVAIPLIKGELGGVEAPAFTLPAFTGFPAFEAMWQTLLLAGLAQIPLTAANAVISPASLIKTYWPDREVKENTIALSNGIMNITLPFLSGMPMCHGAGGLAGKYYFGARTGGTNIIEGTIEIALGLFLATSITSLFTVFPMAILGAMLLMIGIELCKFVGDVRGTANIIPLAVTIIVSLATNMALGFLAGLIVHHGIQRFSMTKDGLP